MSRTKGLPSPEDDDDESPRPVRPPTRTMTPGIVEGAAPGAGPRGNSSSSNLNDDNSTIATADIPPPPTLRNREQAPPLAPPSNDGGRSGRRTVLPYRAPPWQENAPRRTRTTTTSPASRRAHQQQAPMAPADNHDNMSDNQFQVKAFMAALNTQNNNTNDEPRMAPGAIPVQGVNSQGWQSGNDAWDNVAEDNHTVTDTNNEPSNNYHHDVGHHHHHNHPPVIAQLAPDEEDVAARLAERLERQITEQWKERFKQELEAQRQQQQSVIAQAVVTASTDGQWSNDGDIMSVDMDARTTNNDNFKICGIRRRTWGILLILLLLLAGGAAAGVIFYFRSQEDDENNQNPTSAPFTFTPTTLRPTLRHTTMVPTADPDIEAIRNELSDWIAPNQADVIRLYNESSPQYQALNFLADDPWVQNDNDSLATPRLLERYVLLVLYFATDGPNWRLPSWTLEGDACLWNNIPEFESGSDPSALGVYCYMNVDDHDYDMENTVQHLYLPQVGLSGTLPWELKLLSNMEQLELDNNLLRSTIPTELGQLTSLKSLWLSSNFLTGPLPNILSSAMESLDVGQNILTGTLPNQWGIDLMSMYWLAVGSNDLEGTIPESWQSWTSIEILDLESNQITGTFPAVFGVDSSWSMIRSIFVESNDLSGPIPSKLGQLTTLRNLWIRGNQLMGTVPTELAQLTVLETVLFNDNDLTGSLDGILCEIDNNTTSSSRPSFATITTLQADCLANSNGNTQITCSCCTTCCIPDASYCETYNS